MGKILYIVHTKVQQQGKESFHMFVSGNTGWQQTCQDQEHKNTYSVKYCI